MSAGPITFVYANWEALFPEMEAVSEPAATLYFNMATLYVRNDGCGPINDVNMLTTVLYLTTAHLAKIFSNQTNGVPTTGGSSPPNQAVGRIASAAEGSVSTSLEMPEQPPSAAWWNQTIYGAAAWKALAPYRTARYIGPTRRRIFNPPGSYSGNPGWGGWGF
jgi:hypothetical protein